MLPLSHPGVLVVLYASGLLEFASLVVVVFLFEQIHTQQAENLLWINKASSHSKISLEYQFSLPPEMLSDHTKAKFVQRLNP